jgi:hypothetical protein
VNSAFPIECPDCGLILTEDEGPMGSWCDDCGRWVTEEESLEALYGPADPPAAPPGAAKPPPTPAETLPLTGGDG